MVMSLPELRFRRFIDPLMADQWLMTWHEDREISPGVPDLHYVMKIDNSVNLSVAHPDRVPTYRVGWIELKAKDTNVTKSQRITVEPSQHQYIRRWYPHMPIHFMVRIIDDVFVIPGKYHKELASAICLADVSILSDLHFKDRDIVVALPPFLRQVTAV
jgi:hypothetical protein